MITVSHLSPREKWIAAATILCIAVLAADRFIIRPAGRQWKSLAVEIDKNELRLKKNLKLLSMETTLVNKIDGYDRLRDAETSDKQIQGEFLKEIEQAARTAKIRITTMKPLPVREVEFVTRYGAEIEVESTMASFVRYLYAIKKDLSYVKIERINIRQPVRSSRTLKIRVIMSKISL